MTDEKIFLVKPLLEDLDYCIATDNVKMVELTKEEIKLLKNLIVQHIGKFDRKIWILQDKVLLKKLKDVVSYE